MKKSLLLMLTSCFVLSGCAFLDKITATLVFAFFGVAVSSLWWMNVDSYNTLIKIKYSDVIEKIEISEININVIVII